MKYEGKNMKSCRLKKVLIILSMLFLSGIFFLLWQHFLPVKQNNINEVSFETILESTPNEFSTIYSSVSDFVDDQAIEDYANENGYSYYYEEEQVCFYNKFALKTLLVKGIFDESKYDNVEKIGTNFAILTFDTIEQTEQAYNELKCSPNINVDVDQLLYSTVEGETVANATSRQAIGWGYDAIQIQPYQDYLTSEGVDEQIVVAVLDSGINTSHEMLKDRIITDSNNNFIGFGVASSSGTAAYITSNFEDDNGHGSHVAGIICDSTPNNVKILPVKCADSNGHGFFSVSMFNAVFDKMAQLSVTYNFKVVCVNMSFSTKLSNDTNLMNNIETVMKEKLVSNNILPVASAGNSKTYIGKENTYTAPACCESVVTVSAIQKDMFWTGDWLGTYSFDSSYSNYGDFVDISAPGTSVKSAYIGGADKYKSMSGTSMATPYVSAIVALLCLDPMYDNALDIHKIEERLYSLAVDMGTAGKDIYYGYGMVSLGGFKGSVEYSVSDQITTYDGNHHTISLTVTNSSNYIVKYGFSENLITISDITKYADFKNFTNGKKKIYFKIIAVGMEEATGFAYLQINKAELGIAVHNQTGMYGDSPQLNQASYTLTSAVFGDDDLGLSFSTTATNKSKPNTTHPISYSWTNTNYNLTTTQTGIYKVTPRVVTIKLYNQQAIYGDEVSLSNTKFTITAGNIVNNDDLNLSLYVTDDKFVVGGTYDIKVASWNKAYDVKWVSSNLEILPRKIAVEIEQSCEYGEQIKLDTTNFIVRSGTIISGDVLLDKLLVDCEQEFPDVGEYAIIIEKSNSNYNIELENGKLKITPRKLIIKIEENYIYGDEINTDIQKYVVASGSVANEYNLFLKIETTAKQFSNVGTYACSLNFYNKNYSIVLAGDSYVKISPKPISVSIGHASSKCGEEIELGHVEVFSDEVVNDDELGAVLTTTATSTSPAGNYSIRLESISNANYIVVSVNEGMYKLFVDQIHIVINNKTTNYGDEIIFDDSDFEIVEGNIEKDKLDIVLTTTATSTSNVGNYAIEVLSYSSDYEIETTNGVLHIEKRPINIKTQQSGIYGSEHILDANNFVDVDNATIGEDELGLTFSCDIGKYSAAKKYSIVAIWTNNNYAINLVDSFYEILPKDATITIGEMDSIYGNSINSSDIKYLIKGVLNGDNLNIIFSHNVTNKSPIGVYGVSATCSNTNYVVQINDGKIIVKPREIALRVVEKKYYGDETSFETIQTAISGNVVNDDDLNLILSSVVDNKSQVGRYSINLNDFNHNYDVSLAEESFFEVVPRNIVVQVGTVESLYLSEIDLSKVEVDLSQVLFDDELNFILSTTATKTSDAGDYAISLNYTNPNYLVAVKKGTYTIRPKDVRITLNNAEVSYGDKIKLDNTNYVCENELDRQYLQIVLNTDANQYVGVGNYKIKIASHNKNYNILYNDGILKIKPRKITIQLNPQSKGHFTQMDLRQSDYTVIEGSICNNDDLGLTIKSESYPALWGDYKLIGEFSNPNYIVTIINSTLTIKFSYVDGLICAAALILIILLIRLIAKRSFRHRMRNF